MSQIIIWCKFQAIINHKINV